MDVSGAEAITYAIATESRDLSSGFKTFFPDMPGKPVQVGDTWPSKGETTQKTTSMSIRIELQNVNTLEGFETIDGMECARIAAQVTGTISGSGNQMGQDLTFAGTVKGKDVYYFAVKEGVQVTSVTEASVASKAWLKAGDVITAIDGAAVNRVSDVRRRVERLDEGEDFTIAVARDRKTLTLNGKMTSDERVSVRRRVLSSL